MNKNDEDKYTPRSDDIFEVSVESVTSPQTQSSLMNGMDLDLSLAERKSESKDSSHLQEGSILVNFELPDGSFGEHTFKLGQTVEVLKSHIESEYGVSMDQR